MARRRAATHGQATRNDQAGLYVRVSLDRSARGMQDEILSPETQEDRARAYCLAQGWPVAAVERDIDESAYRQHYSQREGLMRLLADVEGGRLTKLVVWKFSRLSRRLKEFIEICDRVEKAGGGVVSVTEQVDTSTPAGRLIRNILASFAQFQAEEIGEQIFETWMTRAKQGKRPGGTHPYGTVNRRGILEPDTDTHPHLLAMYQTYLATGSVRAVLDHLVSGGVQPPRAAEWSVNTIRHILTNPIYVGRIDWAGEVFQAQWAPIIPQDLWDQVQQLLDTRSTGPAERRNTRLLTGLVRCGRCGRPMWIRYGKRLKSGRSQLARLYWCCDPHTQRKGCEGTPYLDAEELEASVWQTVLSLLARPDLDGLIAAAARESAGSAAAESPEHRRRELLTERARIERAAAQLLDLLEAGDISREQFRQRNSLHVERLRSVQATLSSLPPAPALPDRRSLALAATQAKLAVIDMQRRSILADLRVTVLVTGARVYVELPGGVRVKLPATLVGDTLYFRDEYRRLDHKAPLLTDRQIKFLRRTYLWADKRKIAERLGRRYWDVVSAARRLRSEGLLPEL